MWFSYWNDFYFFFGGGAVYRHFPVRNKKHRVIALSNLFLRFCNMALFSLCVTNMNAIKRSLEPDGPLTFGILTILFHFYSFLLFSDPVGSQPLAKRIQSTVDANVGVLCQLKTTQVMVSLLPLLFLAPLVDSRSFASILPLLRSIHILTSCRKVLNPFTWHRNFVQRFVPVL